jgi:SMC interacting uncharacterized protein involved in chromosome segregation
MDELLKHLEKQIRELAGQHEQLKQDSQQLHHSKRLLQSKQQKAINQIETLISSLKSIEKTS